MSPIERSNPRVMAGKAIFTDVSSCVAVVPNPIMATCHGFAWSRPADAWGGSRSVGEGTLKPGRTSAWCEGDRAIAVDVSRQPPGRGEHIQMGKRFAKCLARIGVQHPREYFLRDQQRIRLA